MYFSSCPERHVSLQSSRGADNISSQQQLGIAGTLTTAALARFPKEPPRKRNNVGEDNQRFTSRAYTHTRDRVDEARVTREREYNENLIPAASRAQYRYAKGRVSTFLRGMRVPFGDSCLVSAREVKRLLRAIEIRAIARTSRIEADMNKRDHESTLRNDEDANDVRANKSE